MSGLFNEKNARAQVLEFLMGLSLRQRVELFDESFRQFEESDLDGENNVLYRSVLLVARLTYSNPKNESKIYSAETIPIALPLMTAGGYVSDTVNQSGGCQFCGTELSGFSKSSICPACGATAELT